MAKTRIQKEEAVKDLSEKLSRASSVVFADYKGLTMNQLSALREKLRGVEAQFLITKNTLLQRALKNSTNYPLRSEASQLPTTNLLKGPTATLFGFGDEISPLKFLIKTLKEAQVGPSGSLRIKGGFLGRDFFDSFSLTRLASLPSKAELQAKVASSLASPLYGLARVLQVNLSNLVFALDQIKQKKSTFA